MIFAIYHLDIIESKENTLDVYDGKPVTDGKYQEALEEILQGNLPVYKTDKDGKTKIPLECPVIRKKDGVSLLMLCNEKSHKYMEKKNPEELVYHPGCYVIIDNRQGFVQVAIERSPSFENKPDRVRDLLETTLNNMLKERKVHIKIRARMHEGEFWDAVHEQCDELGDSIRRVVFDFPNPKVVKTVDAPEEMNQRLQILAAFTAAVNAAKGSLRLDADKDKALQLDKTQEDIAQMVALCTRNGYNIAVRFKRYGLYRFGNNIKAFGHMNEDVIQEFIDRVTVMGKKDEATYLLISWLDGIHNSTKDYIDEESVTAA